MNPVDLFPANGIGQEMKKARRRPTGTDPSVRSIDPKLSRADRDRRVVVVVSQIVNIVVVRNLF